MADPLDVLNEIRITLEDLEKATWEYGEIADYAGQCEVQHKVAFAKARLRALGTVGEREARASVESRDEHFRRKAAESRLSAQKELLSTLRARLDALRTLSASTRVAAG